MDKAQYQHLFESIGIPVNQANAAADALARQDAGELPVPLEGEELHAVRSAWLWGCAKGQLGDNASERL